MAKKAHHLAEESRVEIRRYRHEGNDRIKKMFKDKEISEDDERRGLEESQKLTDKKIGEVDEALKTKEKEILSV
jgi:ribosome recycling factor